MHRKQGISVPVVQGTPPAAVGDEKEDSIPYQYLSLTLHTVRDTLGVYGMLQHHFSIFEYAKKFVAWLKQQDVLQTLDIEKIKLQEQTINDKKVYIVRVSEKQYNAMMGPNSFSSILSEEKLNVIAATIQHAFKSRNIGAMKKTFENPAILNNELNQKRLLHSKIQDTGFPNLLYEVLASATPENNLLEELIKHFDNNVISLAFQENNKDGGTIIKAMTGIRKDKSIPLILYEAIIPNTLKKVLTAKSESTGSASLQEALSNIEDKDCEAFLKIVGQNTISAALHNPIDSQSTILFEYANLSERKFLALVTAITPKELGSYLYYDTPLRGKYSGFSTLYRMQSEKNLLAVMKLVSPEDLGKAIAYQDATKWNGLLGLIYNSTDAAALFAIKKIPQEFLDKAVTTRTNNGHTPLHDISQYRGELVVSTLIELCSSDALNLCCNRVGNANLNVINWMSLFLSPATIVKFLTKINTDSLKILLKPDDLNPVAVNYVNKIAEGILNEAAWQNDKLVKKLFDLMGEQLAPIALKHWNEKSKPLSPAVHAGVLAHLIFFSKDEETAFKNYRPMHWHLPDFEEKLDTTPIQTSKGRVLDLTKPTVAQIIWEEGLSSWENYRRLNIYHLNIPYLRPVLEGLYISNKVTTGTQYDFTFISQDAKEETQIRNILDLTKEENTLIKIIKDKDWPDFYNQISDYNYRSPLRKKITKTDTSQFPYKYVHMTNQIVPYKGKRKVKNSKYTKKTSAALISKKMNTVVFGEHDPGRSLVGLLMDLRKCKLKAMLTQDRNTFSRGWVGTEKEVNDYKKLMEGRSYTDVNKFREAVRQNPHILNELLVGISREAIMAIVIATDTPESREAASNRQRQLLFNLQINVPIVYYDRPLQKIRMLFSFRDKLDKELNDNPSILIQKVMLTSSEFFSYIQSISPEALINGISRKSEKHNHATVMHQAALSLNSEDFLKFINLIPKSNLLNVSSLRDRDGNTVFTLIAANQPENVFIEYLTCFGSGQDYVEILHLTDALDTRTGKGDGFITAIIKQTEPAILAMLKLLTLNFFYNSKLSSYLDNLGNNAFHMMANLGKESVFLELLKIMENFNAVAVAPLDQTNNSLDTPLHIMAKNFSETAFIKFFDDFTLAVEHKLFLIVNADKETPIHIATRHQKTKGFSTLIEKLDNNILSSASKIVNKDGQTLLDLIFLHQDNSILSFLNRVNDDALNFLIFNNKDPQLTINRITNLVLHKTGLFNDELLKKLFEHIAIAPILFNAAENLWLDGNELSKYIVNIIKQHYDEHAQFLNENQREIFKAILKDTTSNNEIKNSPVQNLNINQNINTNLEAISIEKIWKKGLASWNEYHDLRKIQNTVPGLTEVLDRLYRMRSVLSGSYQPFELESFHVQFSQVDSRIRQGCGLVKIIEENDWLNNLNKLIDVNFQPNNEILLEAKTDIYEYNFLEGKIQPFNPAEHKRPGDYCYETTARLISSYLNNIILSETNPDKPQVGLLFDSQHCKIKAMLTEDNLLHPSKRIGPLSKIEEYASEIRNSTYTDIFQFSRAVLGRPYQLNQILVQLSRQALLAIVIAEDSFISRNVANERQTQIEDTLRIKIPIVFYDSFLQKIQLYSAEEKLQNKQLLESGKTYNVARENEARLRALSIKADFENESALKKLSIFGTSEKKPKTQQAIINFISAAEKNPNVIWTNVELNVKAMLKKAITKPGKYRAKNTQDFYENEMKKYFTNR